MSALSKAWKYLTGSKPKQKKKKPAPQRQKDREPNKKSGTAAHRGGQSASRNPHKGGAQRARAEAATNKNKPQNTSKSFTPARPSTTTRRSGTVATSRGTERRAAISKVRQAAADKAKSSANKSTTVTKATVTNTSAASKPSKIASTAHHGYKNGADTTRQTQRRAGITRARRAQQVAGDVIQYAGKDLAATTAQFLANAGQNKQTETDYKGFGKSLEAAAKHETKKQSKKQKNMRLNTRTGTWEKVGDTPKWAHNIADSLTKSAEKELEDATKNISDKKTYNVPEIGPKGIGNKILGVESTKSQKKKAKKAIDNQLAEAGLTKANVKTQVDELEKWGADQGWTDDTMLNDGRTWGEVKKQAKKDMLSEVASAQAKAYSGIEDVGKMSKKDLSKMGIKLGVAGAEIMVPYIGTAGKALKAADAIMGGGKALTAAGAGGRVLSEAGEAAVKNAAKQAAKKGVSSAKVVDEIAGTTKNVMKSNLKTSVKREIVANALQDATIGTTIDYMTSQKEGLSGKDAWKYMGKSAVLNAAIGAPIAGIAGRTGKAGKNALKSQIADVAKQEYTAVVEAQRLARKLEAKGFSKSQIESALSKPSVGQYLNAKAAESTAKTLDAKNTLKGMGFKELPDAEKGELVRLTAKQSNGKLTPAEEVRFSKLTQEADAIAKDNAAVRKQIVDSAKIRAEDLNKLSAKTGVEYHITGTDEIAKALAKNGEEVPDTSFNGVVFRDKDGKKHIYINEESEQAHHIILGHETTHLLRGTDHFQGLTSSVRKYAESRGEYSALRKEAESLYAQDIRGMSKEEANAFIDEEVTAELVGRYLFNDGSGEFIAHLAREDRNVFQRIYDYIVDAIKYSKSDTETKQLMDIKREFDKAFKEMGDSVDDVKLSKSSPIVEKKYESAVASGDMNGAKQIVREKASEIPTIAKDKQGRALPLYHGTPSFGFTRFEDAQHETPFIYTSSDRTVAAHYAGDNNYAFTREIGKPYREGDSVEDIIENAKSVYGSDFHVMSTAEKEAKYEQIRDEAVAIADKIDELAAKVDGSHWDDETMNAIAWTEEPFWTMRDGDPYDFKGTGDWSNAEVVRVLSGDIEEYKRNRTIVKKYLEENWDTIGKDEKALLNYLCGYEVGDAAIDIEYGALKVATEDERIVNESGNIAIPSELKNAMDETNKIGAYELYGDVGERPLEFDADGAQFWAVKVPEMGDGFHTTDDICKWAYENGYTSVIMHNIYDYGDKADNYVFFNSRQVKSADPITFDDSGNVIPLSERFNADESDIRFSKSSNLRSRNKRTRAEQAEARNAADAAAAKYGLDWFDETFGGGKQAAKSEPAETKPVETKPAEEAPKSEPEEEAALKEMAEAEEAQAEPPKAQETKAPEAPKEKPEPPEWEPPDPGVLMDDVKIDKAQRKQSIKDVKEALIRKSESPKKITAEESKEIESALDEISAHIHNGDFDGARALSEDLAKKHGQVDDYVSIGGGDEIWEEVKAAKDYLSRLVIHIPDGMGTLKEVKEAHLGDYNWHNLHVRSSKHGTKYGQKAATELDELWTELCDEYPNIFSREMTAPEDRLEKLAEVSSAKKRDSISYERIPPEDVRAEYEDVARDIYDAAEQNASKFEGSSLRTNLDEAAESAAFEERVMSGEARAARPKKEPQAPPKPPEDKHPEIAKLSTNAYTPNAVKDNVMKIRSIGGDEVKEAEKLAAEYNKANKEIAAAKAKMKNSKTPEHIEQYKRDIEAAEKAQKEIAENLETIARRAENDKPAYAALNEEDLAPNDPGWSIPTGKDESAPTEPASKSTIKDASNSEDSIVPKSSWRTSLRRLWESSLVAFETTAKANKNDKLRGQINQVQHWRNNFGHWIEGKRTLMDRKTHRDGLNTIFDRAQLFGKKNIERRNDFVNYLTYKHAIDRLEFDKPVHMAEGGGSKYTAEEYAKMCDDIEAKYRERGEEKLLTDFADDMHKYFDDLLQTRVDSGLISKEFAEELRAKYPNYVPTLRDGDEWIENGIEGGRRTTFGISDSIKTAKGGSSDVMDLYQSALLITRDVIRDSEMNELLRQYAETLGVHGEELSEKQLGELPSFAVNAHKSETGWKVSFFQDGKMVTLGVDKNIARGLREINGQEYQRLLALAGKLSGPMRAFKGPITDYNLIFGVRNSARDIQQAAVNSKSLTYFSANIPTAQASILRKHIPGGKADPWMQSYEATGGMYSSFFQQDKKIAEPGSKTGLRKGIDATAGKVLRGLEQANSAMEITPRLAEYIGTIKKDVEAMLKEDGSSLAQLRKEVSTELFGKSEAALSPKQLNELEDAFAKRVLDMASTETIEKAALNAADITLNFSRNGVIGKALNTGFIPYFNPSIQGLSKTVRMFSENKAEGAKALLNFGMKLGVVSIAPAAMNEILCRDNRDYQNLATREKDTNFFIPLGDGKFIKVPKPRENAVLVEPVTYGLRYFFDKARIGEIEEGEYSQWKDLGQMFISAHDNIAPVPFTENLFSPLLRLAQNKTWYGGSIESTGEVLGKKNGELKNSEIYDDTTSALAIQIGQTKIGGKTISDISHMSPKKIDDLMDSYLGVIYDLGISQTAETTHGNPVVNQFIKDSVFSNKTGTELWAEFEHANAPKTTGGKIKQKAKDVVLGHSALNINEKSQEAKDWLNQKGYDDMTYSTGINTLRKDDSISDKKKENIIRAWKKAQNDMRRDLVYGSKEVSYRNDPLKTIAKAVGVDKAFKDYTYTYVDPDTGEKKNQHLDAWKSYKKSDEYKKDSEKGGQKFIDFYAKMRWTNGRIGENKSYPQWMTASVLAATEKGKNDDLAKAYIRPNGYDDKGKQTKDIDTEYQEKIIQRGKNYRDAGFTQDYYRKSQKTIFEAGRALKYDYTSMMNPWDEAMALANDKAKYKDGAYYSADTSGKVSHRMNYARCLNDKGYSTKDIYKFAKEYDLKLPDNKGIDKAGRANSWKAFDAKVEAAVRDKYGDRPLEEQAAIYHVITDDTYHKPFGDVGDYSLDGDTGITDLDARESGGYGRRRRGRRHGRRGHGGGGGGSTPFTPVVSTAPKPKLTAAKVTNPFGTSNTSKKSTLDDAYRKRAKKLRQTAAKNKLS